MVGGKAAAEARAVTAGAVRCSAWLGRWFILFGCLCLLFAVSKVCHEDKQNGKCDGKANDRVGEQIEQAVRNGHERYANNDDGPTGLRSCGCKPDEPTDCACKCAVENGARHETKDDVRYLLSERCSALNHGVRNVNRISDTLGCGESEAGHEPEKHTIANAGDALLAEAEYEQRQSLASLLEDANAENKAESPRCEVGTLRACKDATCDGENLDETLQRDADESRE